MKKEHFIVNHVSYDNVHTVHDSLTNTSIYETNLRKVYASELLVTIMLCITCIVMYVTGSIIQPHKTAIPVSKGLKRIFQIKK